MELLADIFVDRFEDLANGGVLGKNPDASEDT